MILNIYKEKGWTSFDVVAKVRGIISSGVSQDAQSEGKKNNNAQSKNAQSKRRKSKRKKVGHAGTLDPLAEGVLLILTDEDTKKQADFMRLEKVYVCEISFGATSKTYDLEGELTYKEIPTKLDILSELEKFIPQYIGEIEQRVPPYSAVKMGGKPLYKSARKGKIAVKDLPTKKVKVYNIEILDFFTKDSLPTVKLKIVCGKGFYVRALAHDLGEELGIGGVLASLVRTRVGNFSIEESQKTKDFEAKIKNA